MSQYLERLKKLSKGYKKATAREGGSFFRVPNGTYQVKIADARVDTWPSGKLEGQMRLGVKYTIIAGEFQGKPLFQTINPEFTRTNEDGEVENMGLDMLRTWNTILGYDSDDAVLHLHEICADVIDTICEVYVKNKENGNYSVYLNKVVETEVDEEDLKGASVKAAKKAKKQEEEEEEDEEQVEEEEEEEEEEEDEDWGDEEEEEKKPSKK